MGSFGASSRIAFVTDADPYETQDFQLLDLVLGALDNGFGFRRRSGHWEEEYIDALDVENHMPVDEGDLRPWGGLYLHDLSESAAVLAQEFWDYGRRGFHSQSCRWSDFADWIGNHVGR
ncbi:hypothetical protein CTI14_25215 [Methylobacterium radiotolerans]|nr:hypothetical protein CTI14_25215 [Methylobacterium radiotolerans]